MMLHGVASVSKKSCANILAQGPGSAITIVVGGAAESLAAHPGTADLTLKKRYGFIKMAIRAGADLVPVFSFGENDVSGPRDAHMGMALTITDIRPAVSRHTYDV
jgi:2-acylglycerol O-acyltransferase 2